jgi:hypothetical protein
LLLSQKSWPAKATYMNGFFHTRNLLLSKKNSPTDLEKFIGPRNWPQSGHKDTLQTRTSIAKWYGENENGKQSGFKLQHAVAVKYGQNF